MMQYRDTTDNGKNLRLSEVRQPESLLIDAEICGKISFENMKIIIQCHLF